MHLEEGDAEDVGLGEAEGDSGQGHRNGEEGG